MVLEYVALKSDRPAAKVLRELSSVVESARLLVDDKDRASSSCVVLLSLSRNERRNLLKPGRYYGCGQVVPKQHLKEDMLPPQIRGAKSFVFVRGQSDD